METLGETLPREMARIRDEVMPAFEACGPGGRPGLFVMRLALDAAAKAMAEGDAVGGLTGMAETKRARRFAVKAHGAQKYGADPYVIHLDAVARVLREHRFGREWIVAAYLHDLIEDTPITAADLYLAGFGRVAVEMVEAVTNEPGANRKERAAGTYPKIRRSLEAVVLKLADRIANVEASRRSNPDLLAMYRKEHAAFRSALWREGEAADLWERLDVAIGMEAVRAAEERR